MNEYANAPYSVVAADGTFKRPCLDAERAHELAEDMWLGYDGRREFSVITADGSQTLSLFEAVRH